MRKLLLIASGMLFIAGLCLGFTREYPRGTAVYLKVAREDILSGIGKKPLGTLLKSSEMVVLKDEGEWVRVVVEGWVKKTSLTDSKLAAQGDGFRALQIIVIDRAAAEAVLQELSAGVDFMKLAKEKSIGPAADRGGDLGYFNKGDFLPEFEAEILKLQAGEISSIIETKLGFHIFKRVE